MLKQFSNYCGVNYIKFLRCYPFSQVTIESQALNCSLQYTTKEQDQNYRAVLISAINFEFISALCGGRMRWPDIGGNSCLYWSGPGFRGRVWFNTCIYWNSTFIVKMQPFCPFNCFVLMTRTFQVSESSVLHNINSIFSTKSSSITWLSNFRNSQMDHLKTTLTSLRCFRQYLNFSIRSLFF